MEIVVQDSAGTRLDQYLAARLPELSRARIQALLKSGDILVNGSAAKPKTPVEPGMRIAVTIPEPAAAEAQPQDIPISVLYEDKDVIVIVPTDEAVGKFESGSEVNLTFAGNNAHIFSKETEKNLEW